MEITLLDEIKYNEFAMTHPNYNIYQSVNYGKLMSKNGHNSYYIGMVDGSSIKAAALIIVKTDQDNKRRKMAYAPRGFLIDWNDEELVKGFTKKLIDFLNKRNFTYLKLDPLVPYKYYKNTCEIDTLKNGDESFVSKLQSYGYIHMGYNKGIESTKLRYTSKVNMDTNTIELYRSLTKEAKEKISYSAKSGCKIYRGTKDDIEYLYNLLKDKSYSMDYYYDLYEFFSENNNLELYFAKFEPATYVNASKELFQKEEERNNELNALLQNYSIPNKEEIINKKMESDILLAKYKKNVIDAINQFQSYPSGRIVAGIIVVKSGNSIIVIEDAMDSNYETNYPDYLLKWQLIDKYSKEGYKVFEYNGITGNFKNDANNICEIELSNEIVEYVGEFDLVINKKAYYTGSKLTPIINWLNEPI